MQLEKADQARDVANSLRRIVHGLRVSAHAVEQDLGVTGAQLFVLRELAAEPRISLRRLSERTLTDPSSVSVVVARLVESGMIARHQDQQDARRSVLSLTHRGQSLLRRAPEPFQARLVGALLSLPKTRLRQLCIGLTELENAFETQGAPPMFFDGAPVTTRKRARRGA